jgi:hypothetical protein
MRAPQMRFGLLREIPEMQNDQLRMRHFEGDFFGNSLGTGVVRFLESLWGHDRFLRSRGHHTPEERETSLNRMRPVLKAMPLVAVPDLIAGLEAHAPLYDLFNAERAGILIAAIDRYVATKNAAWRGSAEFRAISAARSKILEKGGVGGLRKLSVCTKFLLGILDNPLPH